MILKLEDVLDMHRRYARSTQERVARENLGDGFLLKSSPVYAAIRRKFKKFGYRFSVKDRFHYHDMKILALPQVLDRKELPYKDIVSSLSYYAKLYPGKIVLNRPVYNSLPQNHILHESAHCVAHSVCFKGGKWQRPKETSERKRHVVKVLLCESFANAIEVFGSLAIDSWWHEFFYIHNTYIHYPREVRNGLKQFVIRQGAQNTFKFIMLAYLAANFLKPVPPRIQDIKQIAFGNAPFQGKDLQTIAIEAEKLSFDFRKSICEQYFSLLGYSKKSTRLLSFDPILFLKKDAVLRQTVDELTSLVTETASGK